MKKFESTAKYNEVKEVAKELGIKFVGVKTIDLIQTVNAEIEKRQEVQEKEVKPKVKERTSKKTLADYGLEENQIVTIIGFEVKGKTILAGRQVSITRTSRTNGYIKGRLINEEDGTLQKTEIAITMDIIIKENTEEGVA